MGVPHNCTMEAQPRITKFFKELAAYMLELLTQEICEI